MEGFILILTWEATKRIPAPHGFRIYSTGELIFKIGKYSGEKNGVTAM
jgi:hypothetical protein